MPSSFIKIGDQSFDTVLLASVEVTQELNRHWWCRIECRQTEDLRIAVEDALGRDLQVITRDQKGAQHIMFDGFVLEATMMYEIFGSFGARITAVSRSYKLDLAPQETYFRKSAMNGMVQQLASRVGVSADVKSKDKSPKNYVQWGETSFQFINRLAAEHRSWLRPTAAGIEVRDQFPTGRKIQWRDEDGLLEFDVEGGLVQPAFSGTHYDARSMQGTTLDAIAAQPEFFSGSARMVAAVGRESKSRMASGYWHLDSRAANGTEYKDVLERASVGTLGGATVAHGSSRTEQLMAGETVEILGNLDAAGVYGLTKVIHRWEKTGYTNEFWCTPWKGYFEPDQPAHKPVYGVVSARVTGHDDKRNMGRITVQYDWQDGSETAWARMIAPHAGSDRGFMFMPEEGDEVLLAFEHGDPERPYVVGCVWNGVNQAPRDLFAAGDIEPNDVKRIVTKSGHRIQLVDTAGQEAIVIATPNAVKIGLYEKTDETGRSMVLLHSEGDIFFGAPDGRVHLHANQLSREVGSPGAASARSPQSSPPSATAAATQPGAATAGPASAQQAGGTALVAGPPMGVGAEKPKKTTWIEIKLVDSEGKAVAGEPYQIELPGGEVTSGRLNSKGTAHIEGIDPGSCKVSFPERDMREWSKKTLPNNQLPS